nr:MAG TPA: hypothetical protein [Caudoviricetes sp.]
MLRFKKSVTLKKSVDINYMEGEQEKVLINDI